MGFQFSTDAADIKDSIVDGLWAMRGKLKFRGEVFYNWDDMSNQAGLH